MKKFISFFIAAIMSANISVNVTAYDFNNVINADMPQLSYGMGLEITDAKDKYGNDIEYSEIAAPFSSEEYPAYYSLVDEGFSTGVSNQGASSNCWAFASVASLESNLLKQNIPQTKESADISESHIVWNALRNNSGDVNDVNAGDGVNADLPYLVGDDWQEAAASILRGSCELEENAKFYPYEFAKMIYDDSNFRNSSYYHLRQVEQIPSDMNTIKERLMDTGALYIGYYMNNSYYVSDNYSYYYPTQKVANHGVAIVGWDDSYSKENFKTQPEGDGAWICKNSWGSDWGDSGYFMMSYYQYLEQVVSFVGDDIDSYDNAYMYDGAGYSKGIYYSADNSNKCSYANIFKTENNERLTSVGIYSLDNNQDYTIDIYTGVSTSPADGTKIYTQTGTIPYIGYYGIELDDKINLDKDTVFSIVVTQINNSGNIAYIPCEILNDGEKTYTYNVKKGQSFILYNGEYTDTTEISDNVEKGNVCIKAFTKYNNTENMLSESISELSLLIDNYNNLEKEDNTEYSFDRLQSGIAKAKEYIESEPDDYKITNNYIAMLKGYYSALQKPLYISNADEFAAYANSFDNKTIRTTEAELISDIVLPDNIQTIGDSMYFYGSLEGHNHKIENINSTLFYYVLNGGINGINVVGNITADTDTSGFIRYLENSTLNRCSFSGNVTVSGDSAYAGGLVYFAYNSVISDCYNNGNISAGYTGGIAFKTYGGVFKNCYDNDDNFICRATVQNAADYINCYSTLNGEPNAEVITTDDLADYRLSHRLNTTDNTENNSGIWSNNGEIPVFADSENTPVYSVKCDCEYIYRKADDKTVLPVNPVYNNNVVINWIYNDSIINEVSDVYEDIILIGDKVLLGDINESGSVENTDIAEILKYAANILTPNERQKIIADTNIDNENNIIDVISLLKYNNSL